MKQQHVAALTSELLGTFVLMVVVLSISSLNYFLFTALAAGLAVAVFVSAVGKVSGGHFNPAITIGQLAIRTVSAKRAIAYILVQSLGAVLGALLYIFLTQAVTPAELGFTVTAEFDWRVLFAEALGAFIFGAAVAAATVQKLSGAQAAMTVGAGLFLGIVSAHLVSLAVINPALGFGLATVTGIDLQYFIGPILGSLLGFYLVSSVIFANKKESSVSAKTVSSTKPMATKKTSLKSKKSTKK